MQEISIVCIGKFSELYWRCAFEEYQKRLSKSCHFNLTELPEYKLPAYPSPALIAKTVETEGKQILNHLSKSQAVFFPLCIEGTLVSSEQLAAKIESAGSENKSCCFIIGGSFGLSENVKKLPGFSISLSRMTFPHQLARVILAEQLYRAFSIMNGGKYHK
jgi:23S rRNA (pseudouridine1915-N3)-methyltransferase